MISEANKVPTTEVLIRILGVFLLAWGLVALPQRFFASFGNGFMNMLSAWVGMLAEPVVGFFLAFRGGMLARMMYGASDGAPK